MEIKYTWCLKTKQNITGKSNKSWNQVIKQLHEFHLNSGGSVKHSVTKDKRLAF